MQSGWTIEAVRTRGSERIDAFHAIAEATDYERKGILFEEAFFVYAGMGDTPPARILESGRARGQSTLLLARCFPDSQILSIEYDPNSEDVPVAEKRLSGESTEAGLAGGSFVVDYRC